MLKILAILPNRTLGMFLLRARRLIFKIFIDNVRVSFFSGPENGITLILLRENIGG